jgi:phospholipid N-methyltransferase
MKQALISFAARDVLSNATVHEAVLFLPKVQLARPLYEEVNEVLLRLGGKWKSGKVKGHVFEGDPSSDLEVVVRTGLMPPKNPTAFFPTPYPIIDRMLRALPQSDGELRVLEPSAGKGAIARALRAHFQRSTVIHCCEIVPAFAAFLRSDGFDVVAEDFLAYHPTELYDVIVMNPPFAVEGDALAYITHIEHACTLLAPGGSLVSIAPAGFVFRSEKRVQHLREHVELQGKWEALDPKSFAESGTNIETVLMTLTTSEQK